MPIQLDENQENVGTTSTPQLQDWSMDPIGISITYYQGQAMPAPVDVEVLFKDVIGTSIDPGVSFTKKIRTFIGETPFPSCVAMSSADSLYSGPSAYADYTNGLGGTMTYTFSNLFLLEPGVYTYLAHHRIIALTEGVTPFELGQYILKVTVRVFPGDAPTFEPNHFDFVWTMGQPDELFSPLIINGEDWVMRCPEGFGFSPAAGVTITAVAGGGFEASGTGEKSFNLVMLHSLEPDEITENPLNFSLIVNGGILNIPIHVQFLQDSGLFLTDESLQFIAYKGISDAPAQSLGVYFGSPYKFVAPPWAIINPTTGNSGIELNVGVLSADNMEEGDYAGTIKVLRTSDDDLLGEIAVTYRVIGKIDLPYEPGYASFTLDRKFIGLSSLMDDTYYEVLLSARLYEFYSTNYRDVSIPLKFPLFKRKQQFSIGDQIDKLMYLMSDFTHHEGTQYRMADVTLDFTEKSYTDAAYSDSHQISNLKFVAGLMVPMPTDAGFLDINQLPNRVTPKSIYYLNVLVLGISTLAIYRNSETEAIKTFNFNALSTGAIGPVLGGGPILSSSANTGYFGSTVSSIRSFKLDMTELEVRQGDTLTMKFFRKGIEGATKLLRVFPSGAESNTIVWENEYKMKSVMEFTGNYKVATEFENRTSSLFLQLVNVLRKIESQKTCKLTINTGWLLKTDIPTVESLMRSKRAALVFEGQTINLVPVQKSMPSLDNTQALISYDIEFEINRAYNEEIYLF